MINQEIAEIFEHIAEILEFQGNPDDYFRIKAYRNAAVAIMDIGENLADAIREKRLRQIRGIGEGIAKKIEEYIKTGAVREYELLKRTGPKGLFELMQIPFLGPKKAKILYQKLGIKDTKDLEHAIKAGKVQKLRGFGEKSAQKLLEGIALKKTMKSRMLFGEIYLAVKNFVADLKKCREIKEALPAGSFRRAEETIGDIDILVTAKKQKDAGKIMDYFVKMPEVKTILSKGETKTSVLTKDGLQIDVRVVKPSQFGSALQYFTGSKQHNVHLRTYAKSKGFKLSEYGFFKHGKLVASKTEQDCYKSLNMQYIPPELRADTGEIEASLRNKIPKDLIQLCDIRGDLHTHSTWSDGRSTIQEMALEACKRGYEYIAVTDHSVSAHIAGGLRISELEKKKHEIEKLNKKLPIKILFGAEVDIKDDGSLDYPDGILKKFDIVIASIHSRFTQDNTKRILRAMENPHVDIIAHPSGRLIGERKPYPLDYEKIFQCACDTDIAIEINAHYLRLDLQDIYMREAKKWGIKFAMNTDAHSSKGLWMMELGTMWARRGWITKKDVINTLTLKDLLSLLA